MSWTPLTSANWDAYIITVEPQSETPVQRNDGDNVITTHDVIQHPSDSSSAREATAAPERTTEDRPG